MSKNKPDIKVAKWSTAKLLLTVYGLFALLLLALLLPLEFAPDYLGTKIYTGTSIGIGLVFVIFGKIIGGSLCEANRRVQKHLWVKVWHMEETEVEKQLKGAFYGYNFNIWIIRIVGILLILFPIKDYLL